MSDSNNNPETFIALFRCKEVRRRDPQIFKGWGQIAAPLTDFKS
jgi:hypothetical protein